MGSEHNLGGYRLSECEPKEWFVVFSEESPKWWVRLLACGRFKHVSVLGKVERAGCWIFHDIWLNRTHIAVIGDWEADAALAHFVGSRTVVRFPRLLADEGGFHPRFGFWCVPAVAHILGIRSCALRPDALFRQILAKGGELIGSGRQGDAAENQGRSGTEAPAGGGTPGEGEHDSRSSLDGD